MHRTERRAGVFLALSVFVGGSIVAVTVSRPSSTAGKVALSVGVFYVEAVAALTEFARLSAVGAVAMNAVYAVAAYVVWWAGSYVVVVRGLERTRGEFRTIALVFPGLVAVVLGGALFVGGMASGAGMLDLGLPRDGRALAFFGGPIVGFFGFLWTTMVHDAGIGWRLQNLKYTNTAIEVGAYLLLFAGLALVLASVVLGVGAQYLMVSLIGVVVAAVSVAAA